MARTKPLTTQMQEVMAQMAEVVKDEKPSHAKSSLLTAQLDALTFLQQREDAAEVATLNAEIESLKKRIAELVAAPPQTTSPSDSSLIDATVAQMLARHYAGTNENRSVLQTPVPVTRERPALVEADPDLLT